VLRAFATLLILGHCGEFACLCAPGGKLAKVREEVSAEPEREPEKLEKGREDEKCDHQPGDSGWLGPLLGDDAWVLLVAPLSGPYYCLDDNFHNQSHFLPYPYSQQTTWPRQHGMQMCGSMWILHETEESAQLKPSTDGEPPLVKLWMANVSVEESNDFDGLNRINGRFLFDHACRLGVQGSWTFLDERLPCGCHDQLWLGDVNLMVRFAECERAQFRVGVGTRFLADRHDADAGINVVYGADFFPFKPVVISTLVDGGTLGSAGVFHARGTWGVMLQRWELFGGYDYLRIGSVDLQGPVLGLRVWF